MSNDEPKTRRPKNTPFKQQRLRAWQPILTPRTVLPTLFVVGLIFIPLGVGFFITSRRVNQVVVDYTHCQDLAPTSLSHTNVPANVVQWQYTPSTRECLVEFKLPVDFLGKVFLYYRLTNFYQNHRRYVKSIDSSQLRGRAVPIGDLSTCEPLIGNGTLPYYPCGLIANSLFNDTFAVLDTNQNTLPFSETGIAWPADIENFKVTSYTADQVLPPPAWTWIPNGVYDSATLKSIASNEHLIVWLRTAALPTFLKLYSRHDGDLKADTYRIRIVNNYNVLMYGGTKSIVISTMSWLGGKNSFLGIAYMTVGTTCIALAILFLIKNILSPRKLGDPAYLSWNQPTSSSSSTSASRR